MKDEDGNTTLCLAGYVGFGANNLSCFLNANHDGTGRLREFDAGILISHDSFSPHLENIDIREIIKLAKERHDLEILT